MTIFKLPAEGRPEIKDIPNTLEALQAEVGGYIETVPLYERDGCLIICNEEGLWQDLPINAWVPTIVGDVFITRIDGEDFTDLTPEDVDFFTCIYGGETDDDADA